MKAAVGLRRCFLIERCPRDVVHAASEMGQFGEQAQQLMLGGVGRGSALSLMPSPSHSVLLQRRRKWLAGCLVLDAWGMQVLPWERKYFGPACLADGPKAWLTIMGCRLATCKRYGVLWLLLQQGTTYSFYELDHPAAASMTQQGNWWWEQPVRKSVVCCL